MNSYILIWLLMLSYVLLNNTIVKCGISARSKSVVSGCLLGLMFLTLWIVIGFREYGTSGDYATYEITWFNQIRKYDLLSLVRSYLWKRDIGFVFLLWIGSCFFDTYRPVFVVIVFLLLLGICASYKRFKVSPIEGLFVLFSLTGFSVFTTTRQGIAFVILFSSVIGVGFVAWGFLIWRIISYYLNIVQGFTITLGDIFVGMVRKKHVNN